MADNTIDAINIPQLHGERKNPLPDDMNCFWEWAMMQPAMYSNAVFESLGQFPG